MKLTILKKPVLLLLFFYFLFSVVLINEGCNQQDEQSKSQEQIVHEFVQKMKNDSLVRIGVENNHKITEELLADRYNLGAVNMDSVLQEEKKLTTGEQKIALYKRAGMTHAREYYNRELKRLAFVMYIHSKYPDVFKLPKETSRKILNAVLTPLDSSVVVRAAQTRITGKKQKKEND